MNGATPTRRRTTTTAKTLGAAVLAVALSSTALSAQVPSGARAAVDRLFEGMRSADPDMVREVLAPDVRFAMVQGDESPATVGVQTVAGWLDGIGRSQGRWDERIYDVEVRTDADMASVWAPYTFYLDGEISHCGINSIELLRDGEGWKITQISDTRRTEGCPDPLG
jgi:hypothetical protein